MINTGREYAFIGDAVWALIVKESLLSAHVNLGKDINIATAHYLSAPAQAELFQKLCDDAYFTDDEIAIYKKGRNIKVTKRNSHENITTYRIASGFEAVIGYLYFNKDINRIKDIFSKMQNENEREKIEKSMGRKID